MLSKNKIVSKSKLVKVDGLSEDIVIMLRDRIWHDKYCWRCHKESPTVHCSTCLRSYHAKCSKNKINKNSTTNKKCDECKTISSSIRECRSKGLHLNYLNDLFEFALSGFTESDEIEKLQITMKHDLLIYPMDYKTIENKVFASKYPSTAHFMGDVKQMQHNCYILHSDNEQLIKIVNDFKKYCDFEIYDIKLCHECYKRKCENIVNVLTAVCRVPHLVVWAKADSFPYWPAKLLSIEQNDAEVVFFGEKNSTAQVSITKCLLFSQEYPFKIPDNYKETFEIGCNEALTYIDNVREKFGSYNILAKAEEIRPDCLNTHRLQIIPTFGSLPGENVQ